MRKKGFTLIELLVVISIIALLLSILMPGLQKAKASAKNLVCRNNQKQLSNAFQSYYLDYNFKSMDSGGSYEFWFLQLGPYLSDAAYTQADYDNDGGSYPKDPESTMKSSMAVNKCPATKPPLKQWDPSQPPDSAVNSTGGTAKNQYRYHRVRVEGSYTMNSWVGGFNWDFDPEMIGPRMASANLAQSYRGNPAANRADIPLLADGTWVEALPTNGDGYNVPDNLTALTEDGQAEWRVGLQRFVTNRHGLDTNIAYCDGHVEKIKLKELWAHRWNKKFEVDRDVQVPRLDDGRGE